MFSNISFSRMTFLVVFCSVVFSISTALAQDGQPCHMSSAPECGGECPPGLSCQVAYDNEFCVCAD